MMSLKKLIQTILKIKNRADNRKPPNDAGKQFNYNIDMIRFTAKQAVIEFISNTRTRIMYQQPHKTTTAVLLI